VPRKPLTLIDEIAFAWGYPRRTVLPVEVRDIGNSASIVISAIRRLLSFGLLSRANALEIVLRRISTSQTSL
jgi:hypothetical protein